MIGAQLLGIGATMLAVAAGSTQTDQTATAAEQLAKDEASAALASSEAGWFLAGRLDARMINFEPALWFGYGLPRRISVALEIAPKINTSAVMLSGGMRFHFDSLELRIHGRYTIGFDGALLAPQERYGLFESQSAAGPSAIYFAVDGMLKWEPVVGPGLLRLELTVTGVPKIDDLNDGWYLLEHRSNAVIAPPWVWTGEVGFLFDLTSDGAGRVGPSVEAVGIPGREQILVRVGARLRWEVYPDWEVRGVFMAPAISPDDLGLGAGTQLELGVRYTWCL